MYDFLILCVFYLTLTYEIVSLVFLFFFKCGIITYKYFFKKGKTDMIYSLEEQTHLTTKEKQTFNNIGNINTKKKGFKRYYNAGLLDNIDEIFIEEVQDYWKKHYKKEIDPLLNLAFMNLTGNKDPRIIPGKEMW